MENLQEEYSLDELKIINIKHLGLTIKPWEFSRGTKTYREYLYDNGSVAIKVVYNYTYTDGERSILPPTRHIDFYDNNGAIFHTSDINKELNIKQLSTLNRDIRQGRIDYMKSAARSLPAFSPYVPEPYKSDFLKGPDAVEVIEFYYKSEMENYVNEGTMALENRVNAETNVFILEVLNLSVRPPDALFPNGLTIKDTFIHQLTGVS